MKRKAFTLVELIVVITILAILWTIAFISLSWYSKEARDAKRATDTSSLLNKINIEYTRWIDISDLIIKTETWSLQILWKTGSLVNTFWIANFEVLKENKENFKDPSNKKQNYPLAYAIGWKWKEKYRFIQIATISEKENKAVIKWNYYRSEDPKDAESLFLTWWIILENWGERLPYPPTSWWDTWWWEKFSCTWKSENAEIFNKDNLTENTSYQNTDPNWKCYLKCLENYKWNWNSCVITQIWEIEVWVDPKTDFIREANPIWEGAWATDLSYTEPTWDANMQKYIYPEWRSEKDYPAFEYCTKLQGWWWRLPTKNELTVLINYEGRDYNINKKVYSNHSWIFPDYYWSSTSADNTRTSYAWYVNFADADTYDDGKTFSTYVVCIHDSSPKLDNWVHNPDASPEKRFWNDTHTISWIEAYKDFYLWNKYWEVNPTWTGSWATNESYTEPIWDSTKKDYIYPTWRTKGDYPAFEYCTSLWTWWWRLPTIEELYSLTTYKKIKNKDNKDVLSNHPWISLNTYWSSTPVCGTSYISSAWLVNFPLADTSSPYKTTSYYVVCIHD